MVGIDEEAARAGVPEHVRDLLRLQGRVQANDDSTGPPRSVARRDILHGIVKEDGHPVAGRDVSREHDPSGLGLGHELVVADAPVAVYRCTPAQERARRPSEDEPVGFRPPREPLHKCGGSRWERHGPGF